MNLVMMVQLAKENSPQPPASFGDTTEARCPPGRGWRRERVQIHFHTNHTWHLKSQGPQAPWALGGAHGQRCQALREGSETWRPCPYVFECEGYCVSVCTNTRLLHTCTPHTPSLSHQAPLPHSSQMQSGHWLPPT